MDEMPMIPALAGGAAATLSELLGALDPDTLDELVEAAYAWVDAGEALPIDLETGASPIAVEEMADDASTEVETEADDEPEEEPEETIEDEAVETEEEQAAELAAGLEDIEAILAQVREAADEVTAIRESCDEILADAKDAEEMGGDPDAVEDVMGELDGLVEEIADLLADADDAAESEDANGVAQAGLHVKEKLALAKALIDQAKVHAGTNEPDTEAVNEATGEPDEMPALSLWAQRYEP